MKTEGYASLVKGRTIFHGITYNHQDGTSTFVEATGEFKASIEAWLNGEEPVFGGKTLPQKDHEERN